MVVIPSYQIIKLNKTKKIMLTSKKVSPYLEKLRSEDSRLLATSSCITPHFHKSSLSISCTHPNGSGWAHPIK